MFPTGTHTCSGPTNPCFPFRYLDIGIVMTVLCLSVHRTVEADNFLSSVTHSQLGGNYTSALVLAGNAPLSGVQDT